MKLKNVVRLVAFTFVVAAVTQELKKPEEEREWHGRVAGFVPYDFRMPTMERIRAAYWNPDDPRVFTDRVLGIGWAINIPAAVGRIREVAGHCCAS